MAVFVLDKRKKPLMPCSEKRARKLLEKGRAVVVKMQPFTIRLKDRMLEESKTQPLRVKIDPGSKTTGLALVREDEDENNQYVVWLAELEHRGGLIKKRMDQRRSYRRSRRYRNLRYRQPRFNNRTKPKRWLAPSLQHRVDTTESWVNKLRNLSPVSGISVELAKFDTQKLDNPDIQDIEYQRGTLYGTEVWEYLLETWGRQCVYCDTTGVPLNKEHIIPRARGGTDRVGNLTVSCVPCNQKKGAQSLEEFLSDDPKRLKRIQNKSCKKSYKDAAAVNATRNALTRTLENTGLPTEVSTGGRTKWNRQRHNIPKTHALDAACVGEFDTVYDWERPVLGIKATGRGMYRRTLLTKYGFPRAYLMKQKQVHGFQTGDYVRAKVLRGSRKGNYYVGKVIVRKSGRFDIKTEEGKRGVTYRYCNILQKADGYSYQYNKTPEA